MIGYQGKILGEPNDPNTVTASGILTDGKIIVGAGNKGVKTFDAPANTFLYVDKDGNLQTLSYAGRTNKQIVVNESGLLTFADYVGETKVFKPTISSFTTNSTSAYFANIGTSLPSLMENLDYCTVSHTTSTVESCNFICTFDKEFVLTKDTVCWVSVAAWFMPWDFNSVQLRYGTIYGTGGTLVGLGANTKTNTGGIGFMKELTIPAGTYNSLYLTPLSGAGQFSLQTLKAGITIVYTE